MEIKVMHQVMAWNDDVSDQVKSELERHRVCLVNVMGSREPARPARSPR